MAHGLARAVILGIHVAPDAVLVGDEPGFTLDNPSCITLGALCSVRFCIVSQVPSAKNFSRL